MISLPCLLLGILIGVIGGTVLGFLLCAWFYKWLTKPAPIGRTRFPPVIAHENIGAKLDAIGVS